MENAEHPLQNIIIRGRSIRFDETGLACLNDIWSAAGFTKNRRPNDWSRLGTTHKRIERVLKLITGKSRNYDKADMQRVLRTRRGADGGTYADARLALDYAEYLNPKLAIEVKETFLRYKAADPSLADEILERASAEDNYRSGIRALGRAKRNDFTDTLKAHGVENKGYMYCTDAMYQNLLGGRSHELRSKMNLPANSNLRDHLDASKLAFVMAAEALAIERIREEGRQGNAACITASVKCASAIKSAIDTDRRNRTKVA